MRIGSSIRIHINVTLAACNEKYSALTLEKFPKNIHNVKMLKKHDGGRGVLAWAKELFYILKIFLLKISSIVFPVSRGNFDPEKQNIVLVYGFGVSPSVFILLKRKFEDSGYNVLIPDLGWAIKDIDIHARRFVRFTREQEKILKETYQKKLSDIKDRTLFLGHSMGGLIILSAQKQEPTLKAFPILTLGTPLHGSPLAYTIPFLKPGREMLPNSQWLCALYKDIRQTPPKLIQVKAVRDEFVPKKYSHIEGFPAHTVPITGHAALLFELTPKMIQKILEEQRGPSR